MVDARIVNLFCYCDSPGGQTLASYKLRCDEFQTRMRGHGMEVR